MDEHDRLAVTELLEPDGDVISPEIESSLRGSRPE